jgi:hypothetical protein
MRPSGSSIGSFVLVAAAAQHRIARSGSRGPARRKKLPNQLALAVTGRCIGTLENVCAEVCQPRLGLFRSTFKAWLQIADFDIEAHAAG